MIALQEGPGGGIPTSLRRGRAPTSPKRGRAPCPVAVRCRFMPVLPGISALHLLCG